MARATRFRIGHAIKQNSTIKINDKAYFDISKNYSNGRGGLWDEEQYIRKIADFIEEYFEVTNLDSNSTSNYNSIPLPLAIVRFNEKLTQNLYEIQNQVVRHTLDRQILDETFEYQWYIDDKFHVFILMPNGSIERDLTSSYLNEINSRIKSNTNVVEIDGGSYKDSIFGKKLIIQKKIHDIVKG